MVKITKKTVYFILVILLFLVILISFMSISRPITVQASVSQLYPDEMINSLTVRGTAESLNKNNIYSTLSLRTKEVAVQVGDRVDEGQVLCKLDATELDMNIEQLRADLNVSQLSSLNQYENSKTIYEDAGKVLSENRNVQVLTAESAVESAKVNLDNAQFTYDNLHHDYVTNNDYQVQLARINLDDAIKNYNDAVIDYNHRSDPNVLQAESTLRAAILDLDTKEATYRNNKNLYNKGQITKLQLIQSENQYKDALNKHQEAKKNLKVAETAQRRTLYQLENALGTAKTDYDNAVTAQLRSLEQARISLEGAQTAYDTTLASYDSVYEAALQELDQYKSNLDGSEIALNKDSMLVNLAKLEKQLEDSVIKSPSSGTVTAVYAEEGSVDTGLLFVVEDTDNLKISSSLKEYDYSRVKVGMDVIIKPDSVGGEEYEGIISKIDPAATKNALGESPNTNVEFGVTVDVTSPETLLKIGMNTRLDIVLEKKSNIYRVQYDAIIANEKGENIIFTTDYASPGVYSIRPIVVETGMSNDFYIEISGNNLSDGMTVINDSTVIVNELQRLNKQLDKIDSLRFRFI